MKRFDFHTHAYPEMIADRLTERMAPYSPAGKRYGNGTLQALTAHNARQEIAACVQLNIAASPGSVPRMNEFAIKANAISGIYAFGALHPAYEKVEEELCRLWDAGIKGIKLHPAAQRFRMDAESVFPLYEAMAKHDMIVLCHCGRDPQDGGIDYAPPMAAARVMEQFPQLKLVLAHLGGMDDLEQAEELLWGNKVYIDLAMTAGYMPQQKIDIFLKKHPTEYILYGSDYPWHDGQELNMLEQMQLSEQQRRQIFWENAAKLLRIEEI